MNIVVAYIPVIHQGYVDFLQKYQPVKLILLSKRLLADERPIQKDIRALSSEMIKQSLLTLDLAKEIVIADSIDTLISESAESSEVIMPDEKFSHDLAMKFLPQKKVIFDSIFLRWDVGKSTTPQAVEYDSEVSKDEFHRKYLNQASELAQKSGDWWRQIGAVVVKDDQIILSSYNQHLPTEQQPYIDGDPRADFHKGDHIELSTAIHAEADLISQAAKEGIALNHCSLYVTTFPCPNCAKLIAKSGIAELFFQDGYAMLDGESILKDAGVKITKVI